jgi:tRNA (guanine-N7-)-methyltransferase
VENPARTAEHLARLEQRREALRTRLGDLLAPAPRFVWEIGCGHGHFLAAYALAHPAVVCIGIDIVRERIERAERKRERARLHNLHFLLAEAAMFLEVLPVNARPTDIFVLFPDPWPKQRHHKHRILQADFLARVAQRAGQGTRLYFRTDHAPYFQAVREVLQVHPDWRMVEENWPFEELTVFQARAPAYQSLIAVSK